MLADRRETAHPPADGLRRRKKSGAAIGSLLICFLSIDSTRSAFVKLRVADVAVHGGTACRQTMVSASSENAKASSQTLLTTVRTTHTLSIPKILRMPSIET